MKSNSGKISPPKAGTLAKNKSRNWTPPATSPQPIPIGTSANSLSAILCPQYLANFCRAENPPWIFPNVGFDSRPGQQFSRLNLKEFQASHPMYMVWIVVDCQEGSPLALCKC